MAIMWYTTEQRVTGPKQHRMKAFDMLTNGWNAAVGVDLQVPIFFLLILR